MGGGASQPLNLQLEGDNVFSHPGIGNFEEGHKPNHATDLNLIWDVFSKMACPFRVASMDELKSLILRGMDDINPVSR